MSTTSVSLPKRTVSDTNIVINGTAKQISVTRVGDTFTLSGMQDISASSSPEFAGITITGESGVGVYTAGVLGAGIAPVEFGGTGLDCSGVTNGQLLIGDTATSKFKLAAITGNAKQVAVTLGGGTIALSTPQDIDTAADVTFKSLILSTPGTDTGTSIVRNGTGNLVELTSSREVKENIVPLTQEIDLNLLGLVEGKCFNYIGSSLKSFGFIAEDLAEIEPKLVIFKDNKPHAIQYDQFIPIIVEWIKKHESINNSSEEILSFKKELSRLEKCYKEHSSFTQDQLDKLSIPQPINNSIQDKEQKTPMMIYALIGVSLLASLASILMR